MLLRRYLAPNPEKGQRYILDDPRRDPWGINSPPIVRVTDVAEGWVRYHFDWQNDAATHDDVMEIGTFRAIYKRMDP